VASSQRSRGGEAEDGRFDDVRVTQWKSDQNTIH
jgi:hypothetical protein